MIIEWIAIEQELPPDMVDVLLFDKQHGEYIGYFFAEKGQFIRYIDGFNSGSITHWQFLPEPPK